MTTGIAATARLGLLLAALAAPLAAAQTIGGTASYAQRVALPPNAVFEARVEDISRADAPSAVLGSMRIENPGNPPIAFSIDVDPARVDARARYSVRATISVDGRLTMTTDRITPVLTQGHGREVTLMLRAVGAPRPALTGGPAAPRPPFRPLPASFAGDLPCADCEALRYRLNLFADRSYFLGTEYVGRRDASDYDIGRWTLSTDGRTLTLHGGREAPERFRVDNERTLRKLALDGSEIQSSLNYSLRRTERFERIEPRLRMRCMYPHFADPGNFTDCLTGQRWPVAQLGDNAALEREYLKARQEPGQPLLVNVEGIVRLLPPMEGSGTRPTLVVQRFIGVWPKETCGPLLATAGLQDSHWVLTALDGRPVAATAPGQRETSLVLHSRQQRYAGWAGCNRLIGGYVLEGNRLTFSPAAGTMMACPEGMEAEKAFIEALPRVQSWRIAGVHLELLDAGGAVVARFESRPLR
jgi:copper homeostasis protein (lipoprotein)